MASPPPAEPATVFTLDTLIVRAAARAVEASQRRRIALSIEAGHLAAPLTGDLARLEATLNEWLEPAIRFHPSREATLAVSAAPLADGWVQVRFELDALGPPAGLRVGHGARMPVGATPCDFTTVLAVAPRAAVAGPLDGRRALLVHDPADDAAAGFAGVIAGLGLRTDLTAPGAGAIERHAAAAASRDGGYTFVLLAGASAGGPGLATVEALTAAAGVLMPAFVLLDVGLDAAALDRARALDVACVRAVPLDLAVLRGQLLRLLLDQADAVPDAADRTAPHVLLAEDHELSRYVAIDMLQSLGIEVEVACDGAEAVRRGLDGRHDLVLMDVHMPVMNGLEATRRLRAHPELAALPIVAMTGNAFAADLQACLDAGMNDHLVKPVDPTVLREMLVRWLPSLPALGPAPRPADAAPARPGPAAVPSIEGIDAAAGLRFFADDPAAYRRALGRFAALYAAGLFGASAPTTDAPSPGRVRRELHSLAGAATAIGATELQREATRVEAWLADTGALPDPQALDRLDAQLNRLAARIDLALDADRTSTSPPSR